MEYAKLIVTFISGGFAGAIFKHLIDKYNNKIQHLECHHIEDEIISKLPLLYCDKKHNNLHSKKFKIINTTNKDISSCKVLFSFETQTNIVKCNSYSKEGADIPKGKITKKNECYFTISNFNRKDVIEVYVELGNINEDKFNITESDVLGIKIKYQDKRKAKERKPVKLVEKRQLEMAS